MASFCEEVRYFVKKGQEWVGVDHDLNTVTPRFQCWYILLKLCGGKKLQPAGSKNGETVYAVVFDLAELDDKQEEDSEFVLFSVNSEDSVEDKERLKVGQETN